MWLRCVFYKNVFVLWLNLNGRSVFRWICIICNGSKMQIATNFIVRVLWRKLKHFLIKNKEKTCRFKSGWKQTRLTKIKHIIFQSMITSSNQPNRNFVFKFAMNYCDIQWSFIRFDRAVWVESESNILSFVLCTNNRMNSSKVRGIFTLEIFLEYLTRRRFHMFKFYLHLKPIKVSI